MGALTDAIGFLVVFELGLAAFDVYAEHKEHQKRLREAPYVRLDSERIHHRTIRIVEIVVGIVVLWAFLGETVAHVTG